MNDAKVRIFGSTQATGEVMKLNKRYRLGVIHT